MAKVVCRIKKVSSMSTVGKASKHNLRLESDVNREHILPSPAGHTLLHGSNNIVDDVKQRLNDAEKNANGKFRSNAVLAVEMILSASPDYFSDEQALTDWTEKNLEWLKKEYVKNLVNVVLHTDEQTPHLHIFIVPIDQKNKLNCRDFFGGKEKLQELQTKSYLAVKDLGIERGTPKEISGATHKKTSTWRKEQLDLDIEKKSMRKAIENIEPIKPNFTGLVKAENADLYYKKEAILSLKKAAPGKMHSLTNENKEIKTKYNFSVKEKNKADEEKKAALEKLAEAERISQKAKKLLFEEREKINAERKNISNAISEAYEEAVEKTLETVVRENFKEELNKTNNKKDITKNMKNTVLSRLR